MESLQQACKMHLGAASSSYFTNRDYPVFDYRWTTELSRLATIDGRAARVCLHDPSSGNLQVMVIAQQPLNYWRPKRHRGSDKSVFVVSGQISYYEFDSDGEIVKRINLDSSRCRVLLIRSSQFHTMIAGPQGSVHAEFISGATRDLSSSTESLSGWPAQDSPQSELFMERLHKYPASENHP